MVDRITATPTKALSAHFLLVALTLLLGCATSSAKRSQEYDDTSVPQNCVVEFDTLSVPTSSPCREVNVAAVESLAPRTIDEIPTEFHDVTLDDAVQLALQQSDVIRDLGGRVLSAPTSTPTIYEPGIEYTDPQFGVEAALSAFDASLSSQFSYALNDRVFNNQTLGGGAQELQQDLSTLQTQLSKVAATGTQMNLRSTFGHDRNNRAGNLFGHLWESQHEAEIRQPLLQGAGLNFNRIAGPNSRPGLRFSNGVVIAQVNNDISKVDFELAVRSLIRDVEAAYWQLFQAYHDFNAKQATRDQAERTWKTVQAKFERGLAGGEADKEAQARAQYYLYADLTLEALNGSNAVPGVYQSERQLRSLLGLPVNDGAMMRPIDTVSDARIVYDWDSLSHQALSRRAELRRQLWTVKQEEMRLVAAKNFLLPRLDASALYRLRGFGDDLFGDGPGRFNSAFQDMENLDHQEWEFGLSLNVPLGQRRAYAGVRHAELRLARERSILREQELQVSHALADAIGRAAQTHASMQASYERMVAAQQRVEATAAAFEADKVPVDLLLDAQERLGAAESRYFQVVVSHAAAETNVRLQSGGLLASHGITLQGDCPMTYAAMPRKNRDLMDYRCQIPCSPSQPFDQNISQREFHPMPQPPIEARITSAHEDVAAFNVRRLNEENVPGHPPPTPTDIDNNF